MRYTHITLHYINVQKFDARVLELWNWIGVGDLTMRRYKVLIGVTALIILFAVILIIGEKTGNLDTSADKMTLGNNTTSQAAEEVNETNVSSGQVSISLEKPPFIE